MATFRGALPASTTQGRFFNDQNYMFNTVLPYGLPLPASSQKDPQFMSEAQKAVRTTDPYLGKLRNSTTESQFENLFYTTQLSDDLLRQIEFCNRADIDDLILNQDKNKSIRCGWLYTPSADPINVTTPQVSRGHLGIADGPFRFTSPPPPDAEWIWDLEVARKKILTDRCKGLRDCENTGDSRYKSCGYCTGIAQGVPVDKKGNVLYPKDPRINCTNGSVILNSAQCPQPQPPPQAVPGEIPRDICSPLDGRLSKECILDVISKSGCTQDGALYAAIEKNDNPSDYLGLLRSAQSLKIYNERASQQLNTEIFRQGQTTRNMVVNQVQQLATTVAQNPGATGLGFAARDLCIVRGAIDEWNPCSEIADSATAPYDLNCLQKNFLQLGGQPAGRKYPTAETKASIYDRIATYGQIRQYWQQLINNTKSKSYSIQRDALLDFYGIDPTVSSMNPIPVVKTPMYNIGDVGMPPGFIQYAPEIVLISTQLIQNPGKNIQSGSILDNLRNSVKSGKKYSLTIDTNNSRSVTYNITEVVTGTDNVNTFTYGFYGAPSNLPKLLEGATKASITIQEFS